MIAIVFEVLLFFLASKCAGLWYVEQARIRYSLLFVYLFYKGKHYKKVGGYGRIDLLVSEAFEGWGQGGEPEC